MGRWFSLYTEVLVRLLPEGDYALALEQLAEALPLEVAVVDRAGHVIVWNRALARATVPREQALGRPILEVFPGLAADRNHDWAASLDRALRDGRPDESPQVPLGDRVVRAVLTPLRRDERVIGAAFVVDDITDRVRTEERRLLRVRSEAVEALGAGIAHEIRNPLNALSLNLQLLCERLADPTTPRADLVGKADAMLAEMRRVDDLVTHLLEVSRGGPPTREPVRIDDVAGRVVDRLRATAERAGVALGLARGSVRTLALDPVRIDRALHNLVRNAIEAAPRGGHVWVATRDDPHSTVVVVDDDGPGIPPADRGRMFELFFTRKRGGTGLGLPLARRAVQDHGGEIEVLERPGGGARFVVHLPADGAGAAAGGTTWRAS
ncbi:MAG: PAS domain-containing protein [Planctomycetes bacterium]|nr:PAS domain-containing protein [Planctomycetota bacterium]